MSDDEEQLSQWGRASESNPQVNVISELPGKRYRITMEVPMFLSIMSMSLSSIAISNIVMYRTCVHSLHNEESVCKTFLAPDKGNVSRPVETEVQKYITFVSTVKTVLESIIPAILAFFLGAWSDTHGRKPLVVWSLFGMALSQMMIVIYSMLNQLGPWWFLLTAIPTSLTGGFTVLFTGAMCYITDITSIENRSLSMTIIQGIVTLGTVVGNVVSSYLLKLVGNVNLLLIAAALIVIAYAFTNIYVKESLTGAVPGTLCSVLDFLLVKEMCHELFKGRPNRGRAQILLLTLANTLAIFILYGNSPLDYMYTRKKLEWSMKDYTIFVSASTTISFVGCFVGVGLLQKLFPISDLAFVLVAFASWMMECFVRAFATVGWHMYLGAGIAAFKSLCAPLIRSCLSKILPLEDIAKVFALMGAIEGICPLFSPVIYNGLYEVTLQQFPGAIYILSAGVSLVCVVMTVIVLYYRRKLPTTPSYLQMEE